MIAFATFTCRAQRNVGHDSDESPITMLDKISTVSDSCVELGSDGSGNKSLKYSYYIELLEMDSASIFDAMTNPNPLIAGYAYVATQEIGLANGRDFFKRQIPQNRTICLRAGESSGILYSRDEFIEVIDGLDLKKFR